MMESPYLEPRRMLQVYDPSVQAQFKEMTPAARLEWLGAINRLYWVGVLSRLKTRRTKTHRNPIKTSRT